MQCHLDHACVCQVFMKSFTFLLILYRELFLVNDIVVSQI